MARIKIPVIGVTLFMVIYNLLPFFGVHSNLIIALFIVSPFAVIWMVYAVLKNGTPSQKTWDEHFYEDYDYRRNGKEELETTATH